MPSRTPTRYPGVTAPTRVVPSGGASCFYVPNLRHDGHDADIREADTWLHGFLTPLLATSQFMRRALLVVTFDEGSRIWGNRIYTAFVGERIPPGITNGTPYTHYSLLRMIEDNYGIGTLGLEDAKATAICCVWRK